MRNVTKIMLIFWMFGLPNGFELLPPTAIAAACDPNRYRENPQMRKKKSREALSKAMELNAKVEMMIAQGSDNAALMIQMLSQSYGFQITAIGQMEGLEREACFKDAAIEHGIKDMYEIGKPRTQHASSLITAGDFNGALESLAIAKQTHRHFSILLY